MFSRDFAVTFEVVCNLEHIVAQTLKVYPPGDRSPSKVIVALDKIRSLTPYHSSIGAALSHDSTYEFAIIAHEYLVFEVCPLALLRRSNFQDLDLPLFRWRIIVYNLLKLQHLG